MAEDGLSSGSLDLGSRLLSTTYRVPTFGSVPSVHSSGCRYCQCQATDLTGWYFLLLGSHSTTPLFGWESFDLDNRNPLAEGTRGLWVYRVLLAL